MRIGDPESTTSHAMKLRDYPSATTYLKQHGLLPADAEDTSVRLVDGARIVYVNDGEILVAERRGTGPVILAKASTEIGERNPWLLRPDSVELIFASASETATAGNEADPEGAVVQARPVEDASDGQTADRPTLPQEAQAPPPTAATAWAHVVVCVAASLAVAAAALLLRRRRRSP